MLENKDIYCRTHDVRRLCGKKRRLCEEFEKEALELKE